MCGVDIVDATNGPLVGEGRLNRIMPFAVTASTSALVAVPATLWIWPGFAVAEFVLAAATLVGSVTPIPPSAPTPQPTPNVAAGYTNPTFA